MRAALLFLLLLTPAPEQDATYTATVTFKTMHCVNCRRGVVSGFKALSGVKKVTLEGTSRKAELQILEKSAISIKALRRAVPRDLTIESCLVAMRGTCRVFGKGVVLTARKSQQRFKLRNFKKEGEVVKDRISDLKKEITPEKNKFRMTGYLVLEKKELVLELTGFSATDWKD